MHESTTRYIKHLAESANFKGSTINLHRNGLIGNRFEMPNVSYTQPVPIIYALFKTWPGFACNISMSYPTTWVAFIQNPGRLL
ncbi:MAG TPA: hypothetical protein DDY13_18085 [Cytophagales bacterium]|jgi:hypothetical protein|nr:hypothetical protein [Cytophagales bacterium]